MIVRDMYRTFWPRFLAGCIDAVLLLPLLPLDSWLQGTLPNSIFLATWFIVYIFAFDFYSVAMHARYGQTVGKMLTRIKVLDLSGGRLSIRQALIRDCVPIALNGIWLVSALPRVLAGLDPYAGELNWLDQFQIFGSLIWFAAELCTMLTNSKRRAIHDYLAHSVVVRLSAYKPEISANAAAA